MRDLMEKCPRFLWCNAPICPLDKDKHLRVELKGEPKCTLDEKIVQKIKKGLTKPFFKEE